MRPDRMCDGWSDCPDGDDEVGCKTTADDHTTCFSWTDITIKIQQSMRCFPARYSTICPNGQDQTNCSDPKRVAMQCLSEEYPTNISIWGYCKDYQLCDDSQRSRSYSLRRKPPKVIALPRSVPSFCASRGARKIFFIE